ncbi:unnamed protein product [Dracunculus medinensis]|uniref:Uncharacterized protein n=1 Tax=Dracunculus medinensis TaxID=318479 RepID=A0A3P7PYF5_DRAME|nr:unnamed protein product [Dracunculus medinensis]
MGSIHFDKSDWLDFGVADKMDPFLLALLSYRRNKIDEAIENCTNILKKNAYDQAAWGLKMACMTEEIYVDELENDERGIAEMLLEDDIIAPNARPGTSFSKPISSPKTQSQAIRQFLALLPRSNTGRPLSGVIRSETSNKAGTMEQALRTSRTAKTTRAASSNSARFIRLGTASMVSQKDGPFLNLSRLNVDKYANDPLLSRLLFEYVFYHEGDMKIAHQIAAIATKCANYSDWYWKNQLGKCYYRLGMYADATKQFLSSLNNQKMVETYAYLAKISKRLDQPFMAIEHYTNGLQTFKNDITLLTGLARVYEQLGDDEKSIDTYKNILRQDPNNIEAIACVAANYFYSDQPEVALRYYRRILQVGVNNAELFMNLGLCCFFCQQFDLAISCIERAQNIASDDVVADVWYNTGNVLLATGDTKMAARCYRLAMAADNSHAESICNLAVLQMREGKLGESQCLFHLAIEKGPYLFEPHYNAALLAYQVTLISDFTFSNPLTKPYSLDFDHSSRVFFLSRNFPNYDPNFFAYHSHRTQLQTIIFQLGHFEESRILVAKALQLFPEHFYSKILANSVDQMYQVN